MSLSPSEPDYPAAHSMDSQWFAVDADGHVARFDTGEAGMVPNGANVELDMSEIATSLPSPADGKTIVDMDSRKTPVAQIKDHVDWTPIPVRNSPSPSFWGKLLIRLGVRRAPVPYSYPQHCVVLIPNNLADFKRDLDSGKARLVETARGRSVYFDQIARDELARIHDAGQCAGCATAYALSDETTDVLTKAGVFHYGHETCDNWIAGPYERTTSPSKPIRIDELPPDVRDQIAPVRFEKIRFTETPWIQPIESFECSSWSAAYLASDWKHVYPVPGMEDQYADEYEDLIEDARFIVAPLPPSSENTAK